MTIGRKLTMGFSVLIVLLLLDSVFFLYTVRRTNEDALQLARIEARLDELTQKMGTSVRETVRGALGYTRDPDGEGRSLAAGSAAGFERFTAAFVEAAETGMERVAAQEAIGLFADVTGVTNRLLDTVDELGRAEGEAEAAALREEQRALVELLEYDRENAGQVLGERVDLLVHAETAEARADAEQAYRAAVTMILLVTLGSILVGGAAAFGTTRSIAGPLRLLTRETIQISRGDLSRRVSVTSGGEAGALASAINQMTENLTEASGLERIVQERTAELERSNTDLEQFAYVASHDLQEPLRMISGYTQLLARRYQDRLDDDANEFIGYAVDGAARMQDLINDLLMFSRVGRGDRPFEETDLDAVFAEAMKDLSAAIVESGAEVTHEPLPTLRADSGQMLQLLLNLIGNAIKFRDGSTPRIHLAVSRYDEGWAFCVRDNGVGIDPQYLQRIFILFQRLYTRNEYPGTGIGLAISKKIVERHGGSMWVESEPGNGSSFYFTIPTRADQVTP